MEMTIQQWQHCFPSAQQSQALSGLVSTMVGDHIGIPGVVLFWKLHMNDVGTSDKSRPLGLCSAGNVCTHHKLYHVSSYWITANFILHNGSWWETFLVKWRTFSTLKRSVLATECFFMNQSIAHRTMQRWSSWLWRGFNTAEVPGSIPGLCITATMQTCRGTSAWSTAQKRSFSQSSTTSVPNKWKKKR